MDTPQERDLAPLLFPLRRDGNNHERGRASSVTRLQSRVLTQQRAPSSVEMDEGTSAEDLSKA